jgi:hypothetical protein
MSTKDNIKNANSIIDQIEKIQKFNKKKSEKIYNNVIKHAINENDKGTPFTTSSLILFYIDNSIRNLIKTNKIKFDALIKKINKSLFNNYGIILRKSDFVAIHKKLSIIIDDLKINSGKLKNSIKKILYDNLGQGLSLTQLTRRLVDLYPSYSQHMGTVVRTGLSRLYQDINVTKFKKLDFNWYIWAGPNDQIIREFPCSHWVWKRFPASQLSILHATRSELWNCRHSIIPIPDDEIDEYPIGNIIYANK